MGEINQIFVLLLTPFVLFITSCTGADNFKISGGINNNPNKTIDPGTVYITSSGFYPRKIGVSVGEKVTWINKDDIEHWVASNEHPTHTDYPDAKYGEPGSYQGSHACRAQGQPKTGAFDACKGILQNENYSFTFQKAGAFHYHDHLNYLLFGSVTIKPLGGS